MDTHDGFLYSNIAPRLFVSQSISLHSLIKAFAVHCCTISSDSVSGQKSIDQNVQMCRLTWVWAVCIYSEGTQLISSVVAMCYSYLEMELPERITLNFGLVTPFVIALQTKKRGKYILHQNVRLVDSLPRYYC